MKKLILALGFVSAQALAVQPFSLPWVNGGSSAIYKSSDHPGAVFVMEAFENFCGTCNENAPNVDEMATEYASNPQVQVLDLALDSSDGEIHQWIAAHSPNHPVVKDVGHTIWTEISEEYIPTVAIVDCHGTIVWKNVGLWDEGVKSQIRAKVSQALQTCGWQDAVPPKSFDTPQAVGTEVSCPVTGEVFAITAKTLSSEYEGKYVYFCCPSCKIKFDADPEKYLSGK